MDFKTALNRIRLLLLFKHRDTYWIDKREGVLEVTRMTEWVRGLLEPEDVYPNVAAFEAAHRDDNELVMLLYSPEEGSIDDLTEIRDFLPDYVRSAPLADPDKNAMYIFALVKDIRKFLDLAELFREPGKDPRIIKKIPVRFITPSTALESLQELMDLSGAAAAASSRSRAVPEERARRHQRVGPNGTSLCCPTTIRRC